MGFLNLVLLEGRLTEDPVWRGDGGNAILTFSLAQNKIGTSAGKATSFSKFYPCFAVGEPARDLYENAKVGTVVRVHGELDFRTWTDAQGKKAKENPVFVQSVEFSSPFSGSKDNR